MAKQISDKDVKTLLEARKVLKKINKKIDRLEAIRSELDSIDPHNSTAANGKKWEDTTIKLYGLLSEMYDKCHVDQEADGHLFITY